MRKVELKTDEHIHASTGSSVSFHLIKWNKGLEPFSVKAGGNINYHSLPIGRTTEHTHEFAEIFLVLSGKIGHFANGELTEVGAGSLVFVRPTDYHCFEYIENESCELVNFSFSLDLLLDLSRYLGNDFFMKRFTAPPLPPLFKLSSTEADRIAHMLLNINAETSKVSVDVARIKVKAVLAELFIKYFLEEYNSQAFSDIPEWLDKLCLEMKRPENLSGGVKKMQVLAPCTPEHLCKVFRKHLSMTPTDFMNEQKLNYAAKRLSDSDDKIYSISLDLGFKSLSRFYNIFRKHYGVSPARYRIIARKTDIPL